MDHTAVTAWSHRFTLIVIGLETKPRELPDPLRENQTNDSIQYASRRSGAHYYEAFKE